VTLRRILTAAAAAALLASTAQPALAQAQPKLREAQIRPAVSSVEGGLWDMSDQMENHVKASAEVNKDPQLNAFVKTVLCKVATEYCGEMRLYVLDRPELNASAAPNGYVDVNSGLLLRAATEDELAFVLAHEVTHFARSHTLERYRQTKQTATAGMILGMGLGIATGGGSLVSDLVYLGAIASLMSYNREQEGEADTLGYGRATKAGYAKGAGAAMWSDVIAETRSSDFPKTRNSEARASIFRTHPITAERVAALQAMGGGDTARDVAAEKKYRAVIRPHLAAWLKDDLRRRDYGQSLYVIDRLSKLGEDMGVLEFYRGEAYRQRRSEGDGAKALEAYKRAVASADVPVAAWRELGEAARKAGDKAAARQAFQTYLDRAPQAQDRWIVESSLKTVQES
jgi:predicted Zn-dependent protease